MTPKNVHRIMPPVYVSAEGALRVGGTRVSLDSVAYGIRRGEPPEDILESFPTLDLKDIRTIHGYFTAHPDELDEYLTECDADWEQARAEIEARFPSGEWRERVRARHAEMLQRR